MGKKDGDESQVAALIDSATTSPADSLDVGLLASLKHLVRASDDNLRLAFLSLMAKFKHKHSQVRYLALLIADELFTRSKLFRTLLVDDLETFMVLSVGYRSDCPLPPPVNRATVLRAKGMEILEKWNDNFGLHYKPLRLGYEYLKNTLRLQFPNLRQAAAQAEQQRKEREARSKALVLEKYENLKRDFPALSADIQQTLTQLDECFEILGTKSIEGSIAPQLIAKDENQDIDDELEDYGSNSLRHTLAQVASQVHAQSCETQDNKPVFDSVRDLCRLITSQHSPTVQNWMSILIRVDTQDRESRDSLFRSVMDVRNQLSAAKTKCAELGIDFQRMKGVDEEDDGIVWEDGGIEIEEGFDVLETSGQKEDEAQKKSTVSLDLKKLDMVSKDDNHQRTKLLEEAPVLPWGSYLDRWGTEHMVPVNQRGLLLESHWGKVDFDALIPADKVAEMNVRASYYTSAREEIPPCLAPLKNGGLCQRRDLRVCPLHGPVRPRDSNGNPISVDLNNQSSISVDSNNQSSMSDSLAQDSNRTRSRASSSVLSEDMELMKEVAAKAVANVRAQDTLQSMKRKDQKLQAKRNREHNAAVLRDAALANTSQGLGEALGEDLERYGGASTGGESKQQQYKKARTSLQAMLRPKPTVKDRLAERLLNSRANDATVRELLRDEDRAYREAFANQW